MKTFKWFKRLQPAKRCQVVAKISWQHACFNGEEQAYTVPGIWSATQAAPLYPTGPTIGFLSVGFVVTADPIIISSMQDLNHFELRINNLNSKGTFRCASPHGIVVKKWSSFVHPATWAAKWYKWDLRLRNCTQGPSWGPHNYNIQNSNFAIGFMIIL